MKKIIAILNHQPTPEQVQELKDWGYECIHIPHPPVDPYLTIDEVLIQAANFWDKEIPAKTPLYDAIWCQGDFRFFWCISELCKRHGLPLFVATTERKAVEKTMPDGSIRKVSTFKHVRFVRIV